MSVAVRSTTGASHAITRNLVRSFAHRASLIGRPAHASPLGRKEKPPSTIWQTLGRPSRRTRLVLAGLTISLAALIAALNTREPAIAHEPFYPRSFTSFTLAAREPVSSTSSIFTLKPTESSQSSDPYVELWKKGLWSLELKQPQLQIARSYTPLPPCVAADGGKDDSAPELKFLIRHDGRGEVSNYLFSLPLGSSIELRGPRVEYQIPEEIDGIVFLAGGTGIGPALQTLQTLIARKAETGLAIPQVKILWANRKREDCVGGVNAQDSNALFSLVRRLLPASRTPIKENDHPKSSASAVESHNPIVKALSKLKAEHPDEIFIEYFVDEEKTLIDGAAIQRHLRSLKFHHEKTPSTASKPGKKLIMVSGPDGFVDYLAGPKGWRLSVQVQGDLGGILGQMKPEGWEVRKL